MDNTVKAKEYYKKAVKLALQNNSKTLQTFKNI